MKQFRTQTIILNRTDYGEADRILTFITPDRGKVTGIAKGVRKSKSKLAGGIELFSVSDISFIPGRRQIDTIVSTRLIKHYGSIVKDLDRTNTAYEFIKILDKITEDAAETDYFELLRQAFEALDENSISLEVIDLWFYMRLLRLAGQAPDFQLDAGGQKVESASRYDFDTEKMRFTLAGKGNFEYSHIKLLRLASRLAEPKVLQRISDIERLVKRPRDLARELAQPPLR